jgi:hypothetical protein
MNAPDATGSTESLLPDHIRDKIRLVIEGLSD